MAGATIDYDALAQQHGGSAAVDYDALAAQHGAVAPPSTAPPAAKSLLQRAKDSFDANTKTSPNDPLLETGLKSVVGAIGTPVLHPLDTLAGLGHMIAHPIDEAHQEVDQLYQDKKDGGLGYAAAKFGGQALGSIALGEAGGELAGAVASKVRPVAGRAVLLGKTPAEAYESALKPSTSISPADRATIVQTGLKHSIPVSKGGIEKLSALIDNYNQEIAAEIAKDPTRPIDPQAVATRARQVVPKFKEQVNAADDLAAIEKSRQQFLKEQGANRGRPAISPQPTGLLDAQGNPIMTPGSPAQPPSPAPAMGAAKAQAMKQGTYRVLKGKFGEQGSASVEAQKALARGLKEEIATQFPEIENLNATESRLLQLDPVLEKAVNRISNHQSLGIGTPIAGAAAKAVTGSSAAGVVGSLVKGVLDNPFVKSRLAIAVSKGGKVPYSQAVARISAYSAALHSASETPEN